MKEVCPEATDPDIRKIMGVRYPGESNASVSSKPKESPKPKQARPQQLPWPENLITEIGLEAIFGSDAYTPLNDDQMHGLEFALDSLKDNEKTAVLLRYKEHKTFREVGGYFSRSNERMRQVIAKSIRKLRHPDRLRYYRDGYQGTIRMREERLRSIKEAIGEKGLIETLNGINVKECELSVRAYNCLHRAGMDTLGQVVEKMNQDPWNILRVRNLGIKSLAEVIDKLERFGVGCDPVREQAKIFYGENNLVSNPLRGK